MLSTSLTELCVLVGALPQADDSLKKLVEKLVDCQQVGGYQV